MEQSNLRVTLATKMHKKAQASAHTFLFNLFQRLLDVFHANYLLFTTNHHSVSHPAQLCLRALWGSLNSRYVKIVASCGRTNQKQEIVGLSWDTRLLGNMLQFKSLSFVRGGFPEELNIWNKRSDEFVLSLFQVFLESSSG